MGRVIHIDCETRSEIDLRSAGVYRYAEHPTTDVWCVSYAFGDEPVKTWRPGEPVPPKILVHALLGEEFVAHNKDFERIICRDILVPRYGWPEIGLDQWHCTAALAQMLSLPRSLDEAAKVIGTPAQKDEEGHRLMLQMSKPRDVHLPGGSLYVELAALPAGDPSITRLPDGRIIRWWYTPEKLARLIQYCERDVEVERAIHKFMISLRPMPPAEREIFLLDCKINDRGLLADFPIIRNAQRIVSDTKEALRREMLTATNGCCSPTQPAAIVGWLTHQKNMQADALDKEAIEELLSRLDLPADARRVVEIRREAAKSSVSKLGSMEARASKDCRIRGNFLYHGAHTGRWSGTGVQFQNLMRPTGNVDIAKAMTAISAGMDAKTIELLFGPPITVISECMRGMITAAPGNDLVAADFANIEGRVNAWLAGEEWKLDAFRNYDTIIGTDENGDPVRKGPDLYLLAASRIYNIPLSNLSKKSPERQIGKVAELALGYQGGIGAFQAMAKTYQVRIDDKLAEKTKAAWRVAHPKIVASWAAMEDAAMRAVANPNEVVWCCDRKLAFVVHRTFLWMRLPSGRLLAYCRPHVALQRRKVKVLDPESNTLKEIELERMAVHFWGVDSKTKKWRRLTGYGGSWCENAVQAVSRDLLAEAMMRAEAAGYAIVLHAHDELVAEIPNSFGNLEEFQQLMAAPPKWAQDCPIAAEGWRGKRYRK